MLPGSWRRSYSSSPRDSNGRPGPSRATFRATGSSRGSGRSRSSSPRTSFATGIQATIGRPCIAAAPGVFYVFRDTAAEQTFVAGRLTRTRRVPSVQLGEEVFKQRQDLLQPLMDFVAQHGRLPIDAELDVAPQIKEVFGSAARAFSLIRRVTGPDPWETVRRERRNDLLVYLALAAFGKRPKFRQLPRHAAMRHPRVLRNLQDGLH